MRAKSRPWTINDQFLYTLVSKDEATTEDKDERTNRKLENEIDSLKDIIARGSDYWTKVLSWGNQRRLLSEKEASIIKMIINMNYTGRIPTDKQAKVVSNARNRLIKEGMPLQF